MNMTYKDSGVDKEEGYRLVEKTRASAKATHNDRVLGGIGSFAAMYDIAGYQHPVLISGTDGVGTKLSVAFQQNRYDTVGIDCVAMCVNDILCHGAKPLFFLDYIGCGKLKVEQAADLVNGIIKGCKHSDCALIGGETAEMPGFYQANDYDIAGFAVGVVEKNAIKGAQLVEIGDKIIGLKSSGLHSNGFSLVRKLFPDLSADISGIKIGEILLTPTKIYTPSVLALIDEYGEVVKSMAHITGGGIIENVPRALPDGACAEIDLDSIPTQIIFDVIAEKGISQAEMLATFNMGVGFCLIVERTQAKAMIKRLHALGETAFELGEVITDRGQGKIVLP